MKIKKCGSVGSGGMPRTAGMMEVFAAVLTAVYLWTQLRKKWFAVLTRTAMAPIPARISNLLSMSRFRSVPLGSVRRYLVHYELHSLWSAKVEPCLGASASHAKIRQPTHVLLGTRRRGDERTDYSSGPQVPYSSFATAPASPMTERLETHDHGVP